MGTRQKAARQGACLLGQIIPGQVKMESQMDVMASTEAAFCGTWRGKGLGILSETEVF